MRSLPDLAATPKFVAPIIDSLGSQVVRNSASPLCLCLFCIASGAKLCFASVQKLSRNVLDLKKINCHLLMVVFRKLG